MTCEHHLCECQMPVPKTDRFCSTACEQAVMHGTTGEGCRCDHEACREITKDLEERPSPPPPLG